MYREDEIISMWSADMYDLDETHITDVNFAMSIIGPFSKRILEIGCGSGRYATILFNIVSDMEYEKAQKLLIEKSANSLLPDGHLLIDYGYTLNPENGMIIQSLTLFGKEQSLS